MYEGNEICENMKANVRIWQGGDPTLQQNRIHTSRACGVLIYELGKGHFIDNDIYDNREWNIEVKRFATPLFEKNRLYGAGMGGVYCHGGGGIGAFTSDFTNRDSARTRFTLTDNDIYANKGVGVSIGDDGVPIVTFNRLYGGQNAAIYVAGSKAQGTITDNEIYENKDGIVLREGACPEIQRNTIRDQTRRGVVVCARGQGVLLDNTISGSGTYNLEVRGEKPREVAPEAAEAELEKKKKLYASMGLLVPLPKDGVTIAGMLTDESGRTSVSLRRNTLIGGKEGSVHLCDWAKGFLKENVLEACEGVSIVLGQGADPEITDNVIKASKSHGIHVTRGGAGRFANNKVEGSGGVGMVLDAEATSDVRANDIYESAEAGVQVAPGARARVCGNTVRDNKGAGVEVLGEGQAQLRENDVHSNLGRGGVLVYGATEVTVHDNHIHENAAVGVLLLDGANPLLSKNRIVDNAAEGVRCSAGAKGRLERNTIQNNGGAGGILAEAGCEPTVGENYLDELHVQGEEGS